VKKYRNIFLLLVCIFFACDPDPSVSTPDIPLFDIEDSYICIPDELKNCTIDGLEGICSWGVSTCYGLIWGECEQTIFPSEEMCDGYDNDCNGEIDEVKPVECEPPGALGMNLVYNHVDELSSCTLGWRYCNDGDWGECLEFTPPTEEICDGLDNDCDGTVDMDGNYGECGITEEGACTMGINICLDSELYCVDSIYPQIEACDNIDNDCDGEIDEEIERLCTSICGIGMETCEYGYWRDCDAPQPTIEICDGLDNDCNGEIDDGIDCECSNDETRPCMSNPCGWGVQVCINGHWGECVGEAPLPEICNNHDDNCNGLVDEHLSIGCYEGPPDTADVGICLAGESICNEGVWSECLGQVLPEDEECNDLDDDCDGIVDNSEQFFQEADIVFNLDVSGSMCDYMSDLLYSISSYVYTLEGDNHLFGLVLIGWSNWVDGYSFPGTAGSPHLYIQLTDIVSFVDILRGITCTGGYYEPVYDSLYFISDPSNPLGIAWRDYATPVVVSIGDEIPQTQIGTTQEDIAEFTEECILPGCNSFTNEYWTDYDPLELFIITQPGFFYLYTDFLFGDSLRTYDIGTASDSMVGIGLDLIFQELCIED